MLSFVGILLAARMKEIIQIATLGAEGTIILKFIFYQIPYILPIAIPLSALIASLILIQRLSKSQELTALRASGHSLKTLLLPLYTASLVLAGLNFYIVSEVASSSHLNSKKLEHELRSLNPLYLLHNKSSRLFKNLYVQALGPSSKSDRVSDLVMGFWNEERKSMVVAVAKDVLVNLDVFDINALTLIATEEPLEKHPLPNLFLENIERSSMPVGGFAQLFGTHSWKFQTTYLTLPLLWIHLQSQKKILYELKKDKKSSEEMLLTERKIQESYSEILRRISISIAVITFTLLGTAFGMSIGRKSSYFGGVTVIALAAFFLICYFSAKRTEDSALLSGILYFLPHALISILSLRTLYRISRGLA